MKFKRYIIEKKAILTGNQYKDKFISLLNKWDKDLSRMTKAYKSLKATDSKELLEMSPDGYVPIKNFDNHPSIKEFKKLRSYFITFAKNFENWIYTKILDNRKIKEETYYQTEVRKTAWTFYINLGVYSLFPEDYIRGTDKHIPAPWLLDSNYKNNSRKTNITRYQNAWRKFKEAFVDMINYESEKIEELQDEKIQISGVNINIKNKPNDERSDKYIKDMISHLRKTIQVIKKEGLSKAIKGFRIEYNFNPSTVQGLPNQGALTSGAYRKEDDTLYLFPLSRDKITDSTLIHELGHRYWFKYVPNRAQKAWEDKITSKVVTVEKEHIQKFFDMFYNKEEYYGFLTSREIKKEIEKIKDPTLKVIFYYLQDNRPFFSVEQSEKHEYDSYFDFMVKRTKGEQIPLEWISDYGRTNPAEAFAEAFKIWVGGQKGKLGPWTRSFFKEIVSTGGANIKEGEDMDLMEKYLGEAGDYKSRFKNWKELINKELTTEKQLKAVMKMEDQGYKVVSWESDFVAMINKDYQPAEVYKDGKIKKIKAKKVKETKPKNAKTLPTKKFLSSIFGPEVMKDLEKGKHYV